MSMKFYNQLQRDLAKLAEVKQDHPYLRTVIGHVRKAVEHASYEGWSKEQVQQAVNNIKTGEKE